MLYMDKDQLNRRKAYQYARQAAEMGSAGSAFLAGVFLLIGNGCTPDYDNAMRLLRYARENGVYEAEFFLELAEATQGV